MRRGRARPRWPRRRAAAARRRAQAAAGRIRLRRPEARAQPKPPAAGASNGRRGGRKEWAGAWGEAWARRPAGSGGAECEERRIELAWQGVGRRSSGQRGRNGGAARLLVLARKRRERHVRLDVRADCCDMQFVVSTLRHGEDVNTAPRRAGVNKHDVARQLHLSHLRRHSG